MFQVSDSPSNSDVREEEYVDEDHESPPGGAPSRKLPGGKKMTKPGQKRNPFHQGQSK